MIITEALMHLTPEKPDIARTSWEGFQFVRLNVNAFILYTPNGAGDWKPTRNDLLAFDWFIP